jgi:hypothetical protein
LTIQCYYKRSWSSTKNDQKTTIGLADFIVGCDSYRRYQSFGSYWMNGCFWLVWLVLPI